MTICTIDVHSRDVVAKIISAKIENASAFQWQSQLRHRYCFVLFCFVCTVALLMTELSCLIEFLSSYLFL